MFKKEIWKNFDYWLLGSVVFLCLFGIVMIQSAIGGNTLLAGLPSRQAIFFAIGFGVIIVMSLIDYHYWATFMRFLYIFAVAALLVIFVVGSARFGSARWIETGIFSIQPSELVKVLMIMVLADFFARNQNVTHDWRWVMRSFLLTTGVAIWIALQPNLSTTIVIFVIWFILLWLSGLPLRYIATFVLLVIVVAVAIFPLLQPYQQGRIISFLFPNPDDRYGNNYNVQQALIAIGSGGLFGQGYGHGTQVQLRFLQVRQTDYIFSAIAEEFGFVGTVSIIGLLVFVIIRCIRAGRLASDLFGSLLAYGFASLLFFQMAVNIGVNLRVVPVTGLTLPFVSYGGSSLLSMVLGVGLVESVVSRRRTV
jgi:rod shape determining protein RodA